MRWRCSLALVVAACSSDPVTWDCGGSVDVLYRGTVWGENLAVGDGRVYFSWYENAAGDHHAIESVSTTCGAAETTSWLGGEQDLFGKGMAVHGGSVFWSEAVTEFGDVAIWAAPATANSHNPRVQLATFDNIVPFVDGGDALYALGISLMFVRIPYDGSAISTLVAPLDPNLLWLTAADSKLYYAYNGTVVALDLASGTQTSFAVAQYSGGQFDVDATNLYVPIHDGVAIVPLDGSPQTILVTGNPWNSVVLGADGLYGQTQDMLARMAMTGGTPTQLAPLGQGGSIVRDGNTIYATACCADVLAVTAE